MPFFTKQRAIRKPIGGKDHASILIAPILFDSENLDIKLPLHLKPRGLFAHSRDLLSIVMNV
jgi:hypothetical protein